MNVAEQVHQPLSVGMHLLLGAMPSMAARDEYLYLAEMLKAQDIEPSRTSCMLQMRAHQHMMSCQLT